MVPLPPYARRIEYLESTGTQWIDTGIRFFADFEVDVRLRVSAPSRVLGINPTNCLQRINQQSPYWRFTTGGAHTDTTVRITERHTMAWKSGKIMADDVLLASKNKLFSTGAFQLFGASGSAYPNMIYWCRLYDSSGALVRSFVPCRILDTGYLWDEVEGRFYGNQGTGSFVLGRDVREGVVPTRLNPFGVGRRQEEIRRVEYIEANANDGTAQYIDTLVPVTTDTIVEAEWTQTGTAIQQMLFGVNDGSEKVFALYINNNLKWAVNTGTIAGGAMQDATLGDWSGSFNLGTGVCVLNGTSLSNGGTPFSSDNTIPIFARRNAGIPLFSDYPATMRLKSFRTTQGGVTVFDGVPVRVGSTGYLLDRVSGRLFGNSGTGDFVLGPDIVPVEYVESTGAQYVDTGVVPTPTLSLDCSGYFPNAVPGTRFGSRVSASSECFYISGVTYDNVDRARLSFGQSGTGSQLQRYADPKPLRRFIFDAASKSASIEYADGTSGALSFTQAAFTGTYPIYLLATNMAGTASFSISGTRLSACRIIDGTTLVRSYVPVRVGTEGALYDRVTDTVFRSATSTSLIAGPDLRR